MQALQQFVSRLPWDWTPVRRPSPVWQVARGVVRSSAIEPSGQDARGWLPKDAREVTAPTVWLCEQAREDTEGSVVGAGLVRPDGTASPRAPSPHRLRRTWSLAVARASGADDLPVPIAPDVDRMLAAGEGAGGELLAEGGGFVGQDEDQPPPTAHQTGLARHFPAATTKGHFPQAISRRGTTTPVSP
ncbi:hypothetical protein [Streptomyces flavofungini]|uniref:hypothetical protein n=1 Tax=Streptomyces flavofungini TaxID=68200 RepID=UPI0034DF44E0